ncbi:DUF6457 domain-containing protein [Microbacterium aureliae]
MSEQTHLPPEALDDWAAALQERFDLEAGQVPVSGVLDLARDVAVGVARPAAPVGAFAAGLAAGLRGGDADAIRDALAAVTDLARTVDHADAPAADDAVVDPDADVIGTA